MIENGLKFLLFFVVFSAGVAWNGFFLSKEKEEIICFPNALFCAGVTLILCILAPSAPFNFLVSVGVMAGISCISWMTYRDTLRFLVSFTCFYLGVLYLTDTILLLILKEYLSLPGTVWFSLLVFSKLFILILPFVWKKGVSGLQNCRPYAQSVYGTPIVGFFGIAFLCSRTFTSEEPLALTVVWVVLSAVLFLRIMLAYSHIRYQKEKELLSTIAMQKELLEKNYDALNRSYRVNARLFHDFHRHLEVLHQMALKGGDTDLLAYIETLGSPLKEIAAAVWTGDETVDYMINSRNSRARELGIHMEMNIEFPYNTNIRSNDLCTMLSNLLDNALEACERKGFPNAPRIFLTIRRIQNILVIKLENSSREPDREDEEVLRTSKEDTGLHGWGMQNVEEAAAKYDGIVQTSYSDNLFQTIITLSFEGVEVQRNGSCD